MLRLSISSVVDPGIYTGILLLLLIPCPTAAPRVTPSSGGVTPSSGAVTPSRRRLSRRVAVVSRRVAAAGGVSRRTPRRVLALDTGANAPYSG